jgi:Protein of unknown function (DUF3105)
MADTQPNPTPPQVRVATTRPPERRGWSKGDIREEQRARARSRRNRKRMLITSGALAFAILVIAGITVVPGLNATRSNQLKGINTGGPVPIAADDGQQHVSPGESHAPYSTEPATSGPHWHIAPGASTLAPYGAPARWGVYPVALPDEVLIHNLEHGGIGLHYDCPEGCPDIVKGLEDIVPGSPSFYIMAPYAGLPKKIAITAWRHVMYLDELDRDKILEFVREYIDRAPESVPQDQF